MSTRQIPKIFLGAAALLLLVTGCFIISQQGRQESQLAQIRLAQDQPQLIEELAREVERMSDATTLVDVNQARYRLGSVVVQFDQVLGSMLQGGYLENHSGQRLQVAKVEAAETRLLLENAAGLWRETGVSLADLAGGEFSIFSSAGQEAIRSLETNQSELASLFQQITITLEQSQEQQKVTLALARWLAMGLGALLLVMGLLVWRSERPQAQAAAPRATAGNWGQPAPQHQETNSPQPAAQSAQVQPAQVQSVATAPASSLYTPPVNFDNLNASVDNISVDLGTIASSTEKMHQAIESVSHGMQGLLYSLKEMASSTAEDARLLHNANNAAGFTTESSAELSASAREMSKVIDKVTQLALKTKQIAGSLETDSIQLDNDGDSHTSVVAAEIQQLAHQTSHATGDIELTVSTILTTARLYDEAIGQIIKNVSKINQISQNLGCMVTAGPPILSAPARAGQAQLSVQRPLAPVAPMAPIEPVTETAPALEPDEEPEFDFEVDDSQPGITDELSQALSAIKEVQAAAPELNQPEDPQEAAEETAEKSTAQAEPEADTPTEESEASDQSSGKVFVLDTAESPEGESDDAPNLEEAAAETAPESEPDAEVTVEPVAAEIEIAATDVPSDQGEAVEPVPELDEPEQDAVVTENDSETDPETDEEKPAPVEGDNPNVFIMP